MTVVFCGGCFDLLHYGHVSLLRRARKLGDRLIVGLNTDASIEALKGPGRPIVPYAERYECLVALRYVDEVIPIVDRDPCALLSMLKPDVVVKGPGYSVAGMIERFVVNEYGGQIVILDGPPVSTTILLLSGDERCDHEAAAVSANPGGQVVPAAVSVSGAGHRH